MIRFGWLCCALAVFLVSLPVTSVGQDKVSGWMPKVFPITFWCGPPEPYITIAQYRAIADAGFTVVMPPCEGDATAVRNRKILDLCSKTNLRAIISDSRMPHSLTHDPKGAASVRNIVNDYRKSPTLLGYYLADEPGANSFDDLAEVSAELHRLDPDRMVFINLFPNYASSDLTSNPSQLNALTYDQYLDRFMQVVKPDVLSWDHYFFLEGSDRPGFFSNLASGQRAANATQPPTPFWQVVLSVQHGPYRALTENELRFEAMQTLAYGAKGLAYFTYWEPNDPSFKWSNAIRKRDGTPGTLYDPVSRVNSEVHALAKWLYEAHVEETFQTGQMPPDGKPQPDNSLVKVTGGGDLTAATFLGDKGFVYVLLANRNYRAGVKTQIGLQAGKRAIEQLTLATGQWHEITSKPQTDGIQSASVELGPAGAALFRWK